MIARCARGSSFNTSVVSVSSVVSLRGSAAWDAGSQNCRKHPMPSGAAVPHEADEGTDPPGPGAGFGIEGAGGSGIGAVRQAGAGAAGAALGCARSGAEPAMHPAAPVRHGRLATTAAAAGAGATARGSQEVAGARAVTESAAAVRRQAGDRRDRRKRAMEPMPSGGRGGGGRDHRCIFLLQVL